MDQSPEFIELVTTAHKRMTECQDHLRKQFHLNEWPRYDWYQETGTLVFSDPSGPKLVAEVEFVGSISTRSDTWLWAWANDSVDEKVKARICRVREYGEEHGVPQLTTDQWHAHEVDGWEMTSIAGYLLGAKGSYRTPMNNGFTYMLIMDVTWAS